MTGDASRSPHGWPVAHVCKQRYGQQGRWEESMWQSIRTLTVAALLCSGLAPATLAQTSPTTPQVPPGAGRTPPALEAGQGVIYLSATLGNSARPIVSGLHWRVFQERAEADGSHLLVAESQEPAPIFPVQDGAYVVHVGYGLASAMKRVVVNGQPLSERLPITAGALSVTSVLGDTKLLPSRVQIAVYVPDRNGQEARLVVPDAKPGDVLRLPEGNYRVVSTFLEKETAGSTPAPGAQANATNSVVNAELRVQSGRITEATLRHRAAVMTLKLVNNLGGEALANTSFSVLTPGGDVIRELIGAFPSLVLAEGEYVVIARRDGKTYQTTFTVQSTLDRDVEVVAK